MTEIMWRVLPFPAFDKSIDREGIQSENWVDLADFLTNGSSGVTVARLTGDVEGINDNALIVYDTQLAPEKGDRVLNHKREVFEYVSGDVFATVTCIISPQASHKRQRQK